MGISTISELNLKFKSNEDRFSFERSRLRRFFSDMDSAPVSGSQYFLIKIHQYVILKNYLMQWNVDEHISYTFKLIAFLQKYVVVFMLMYDYASFIQNLFLQSLD